MRRLLVLFACIASLTSASAVRAQEPVATAAIRNVTVIDVKTGARPADQTVLVNTNRIATVGPAAEIRVPPGVRTIDGRGKFLIPGMWEMHAHAFEHYGIDYSYGMEPFQLFVANGITAVRDMGSSVDQLLVGRKRLRELSVVGPRMFGSGPLLEAGEPNIRFAPLTKMVPTPQAGRLAVPAPKEVGVDFLKIHDGLARETYFAIAESAKRAGIAFAGHVPADVTIVEASDAGQVSLEHLAALTRYCLKAPDTAEIDQPKCAAGLARLRANGTFLGPTLVGAVPIAAGDPRVAESRLQYVKAAKRSTWRLPAGPVTADRQARYQLSQRLTRMAAEAGVRLILSTDTGAPLRVPGFATVDEVVLLVDAGVSALDALRAATLHPATLLKLENSAGTVEAGKFADLVVLEGDPLADIRNVTRIAAVIADGRVIETPDKQRLLDSVLASSREP